jgi:hypothetical protein
LAVLLLVPAGSLNELVSQEREKINDFIFYR